MQLEHAPGAITLVVLISLHESRAEPRLDHSTHMPKLACAKWLSMSSSSLRSISAPTADLSHW